MAEQQEKPKQEIVSITVRNSDGTLREARRDGSGRFKKVPKMIPTIEVTAKLRKYLEKPLIGKDGVKKFNTILEGMVKSMVEIATGETDIPVAGRMAAVQAFEAVLLRAHGKPSINDEEKEALKYGGVKVVMIPAPVGLPEVEEEERKALTVPAFLVPESIDTNPPKE